MEAEVGVETDLDPLTFAKMPLVWIGRRWGKKLLSLETVVDSSGGVGNMLKLKTQFTSTQTHLAQTIQTWAPDPFLRTKNSKEHSKNKHPQYEKKLNCYKIKYSDAWKLWPSYEPDFP